MDLFLNRLGFTCVVAADLGLFLLFLAAVSISFVTHRRQY